MKFLFLIGYRGSGKSTVAPLLAELAGCQWLDTDQSIVTAAGKPIAEIFADSGATEFRRLETAAIQRATEQTAPLIVSLGGGAVTIAASRNIIAANGPAVYLRGTVDTLWQRISTDPSSGAQRPNLTELGGRQEVQQMLEQREAIYEAASDLQVDVDSMPPAQIAAEIFQWWRDGGPSETAEIG